METPGAPTLFINSSDASAILFWTTNASGYLLEHNSNLAVTNGWSTVLPTPVSTNGFNYVTNPIAPGNNFYRLRHP